MTPELIELIRKAKERVDAMTPEERAAMYRQQRDGWVKAEMQWDRDFREGKCIHD